MKLYICGNGLDKHLGFLSDYYEYRKFLLENQLFNTEMVNILEKSKYFGFSSLDQNNNTWSNLEEALNLNFELYINDCIELFNRKRNKPGEPISEEIIRKHQEFEGNDFKRYVHDFTKRNFEEWIVKMYFGSIESVRKNYSEFLNEQIKKKNYFLTFNYTTSLEDIFKIERENIMYIHNRFPRSKDEGKLEKIDFSDPEIELRSSSGYFQFGSVENLNFDIQKYVKSLDIKCNDKMFSLQDLINGLESYRFELSKNISSNFMDLERFLMDKDFDEVVILGHSYLGIDKPYYDEILMPKLKGCKWTIYYHSDKDFSSAQNFENEYLC